MNRYLARIAVFLPVLATPAQDPLPAIVARYDESFDAARDLAATKLVPLAGPGRTRLAAARNGGKRVAMTGDTGFAVPCGPGSRVELSFDFERGNGGGSFLLGDDRDPQHGFSRILSVGSGGRLRLTGRDRDLVLAAGRVYRISVAWRWVQKTRCVVEGLRVVGPGGTTVLGSNVTLGGREGAPIPFRHSGSAPAFVDNLLLRVRR